MVRLAYELGGSHIAAGVRMLPILVYSRRLRLAAFEVREPSSR
jgi:hypothetical protein